MTDSPLKELRKRKGLSQSNVAVAIGMTITGYCNLENGKSKLLDSKFRNVMKLADVLGDEVYQIARDEEEKK